MEQLNKEFQVSKVNNDDSITLAKSLSGIVKKHLPEDLFLQRQATSLSLASADIEILRARSFENEYTETIEDLDDERDDLTIVMESEAKSKSRLTRSFPVIASSAEALLKAYSQTPVSIAAGYNEETNQIHARIRLLNTPEYSAHLANTTLNDVFDRYIEVQEEFDKISAQKVALESIKLRGTVREQVRKINLRINYTLSYLEAQYMDLPGDYSAVVTEVSEAVKEVMAEAQARITRKLNEISAKANSAE